MSGIVNTVIHYKDGRGRSPFERWMAKLRDRDAAGRIEAHIKKLELGLPCDARSVGGGVSELRIDYGPGYRVYYGKRGERVYILLCGGDKSSQQRDIERAKDNWKDCKRRGQA